MLYQEINCHLLLMLFLFCKFVDQVCLIAYEHELNMCFCSFDSSWLQREVTKYFPGEDTYLGMSKEDLCSTIFDVLTASNSDEQLQNDVSTG